jgi:bifunctional enzyme CysN/CysC
MADQTIQDGVNALIAEDIDAYLDVHEHKDMLRFLTCGSVDDGKSTLIGRLLYESHLVFDDHLAALEADSRRVGTQGGDLDFALLVDGLSAEREQGITIDVAYRFFSTERRKFIVADTPGHEQYTRNMVTGASNADAAVILVDARKGLLTQTRRHSYLVSLLGIEHVIVAINKLDLVDYSQEICNDIEAGYRELASELGIDDVTCIPISALKGDNIITASPNTPWYGGAHAAPTPRNRRDRRPRHAQSVPHAGAVGQPPQPRLPRVFGAHRRRRHRCGRPDPGTAVGQTQHCHRDHHLRRAARPRRRRAIGHHRARRRDRCQQG